MVWREIGVEEVSVQSEGLVDELARAIQLDSESVAMDGGIPHLVIDGCSYIFDCSSDVVDDPSL